MLRLQKRTMKLRRHRRVRSKISGTAELPRLSVFRSNRYVSAQLIDDAAARTLASASHFEMKSVAKNLKPADIAGKIGEMIAKKALDKNIKGAVFDRGGYKYHGIIKSLAEGARRGGLRL